MAKVFPTTFRSIHVTGEFSPFHAKRPEGAPADQPVLVGMPGIDKMFVVVFSTPEKLREGMKIHAPGIDYKIKKIDDGHDFCASIWEAGLRIMRDPYIVDGWKTHWTEIMPDTTERN